MGSMIVCSQSAQSGRFAYRLQITNFLIPLVKIIKSSIELTTIILIFYTFINVFQAKDSNLRKLAYGGSLGRLNHHGRTPLQMRANHHNHHQILTPVLSFMSRSFSISPPFLSIRVYNNKDNDAIKISNF